MAPGSYDTSRRRLRCGVRRAWIGRVWIRWCSLAWIWRYWILRWRYSRRLLRLIWGRRLSRDGGSDLRRRGRITGCGLLFGSCRRSCCGSSGGSHWRVSRRLSDCGSTTLLSHRCSLWGCIRARTLLGLPVIRHQCKCADCTASQQNDGTYAYTYDQRN
jgi:hypothetical protein